MATYKAGFELVDYAVCLGSLVISFSIGAFFACYHGGQYNKQQYLLGNRELSVFPVSLSMLVTYVSSFATLGYPAETYLYGPQIMLCSVSISIGCLLSAAFFIPLLYPLRLLSINEYFEMRFKGKMTKYAASLTTLITMELLCAMNLYAPAVAIQVVTGHPVWLTMVVTGAITTIYTTMGGLKGVIYTDVFQAFIIFLGILAVTIQGTIHVGGFNRVLEINAQWQRDTMFDFDPDPTKRLSFWSLVIVNSLMWTSIGATQTSMQRYNALPSMRKAQMAQLLNIPGFALIGPMTCFCGMVAFAFYAQQGCDPIRAGLVANPNQILPYFAMDILKYPGMMGLFIAALLSTAVSSQSSCFNSMAAITYEDYLRDYLSQLSSRVQTLVIKALVLCYGIFAIMLAFSIEKFGGTLTQLAYSIMGSTQGPMVGILLVAATLPLAGEVGVVVGVAIGFSASIGLGLSASIAGIKAPPLPSPTMNCPATNYLLNATTRVMNAGVITASELHSTNESFDLTKQPDEVTAYNFHTYLSGWDRLFSLSFLWYPVIGCGIVYFCALIFSFIPARGCRMMERVSSHLLFRCMRRFAGTAWGDLCGVPDGNDLPLKEEYKSPENSEKVHGTDGFIHSFNVIFNPEVTRT